MADGSSADDLHEGRRGFADAIADDIAFLEDWGRGRFPTLSAFFRARQILRANPDLAVTMLGRSRDIS
jgi:hypothetical protein